MFTVAHYMKKSHNRMHFIGSLTYIERIKYGNGRP